MNISRETDRMPQPYTPTPDGFERRLRAWVRLPTDGAPTPDTGEASTHMAKASFTLVGNCPDSCRRDYLKE
jgi:hypothetical protein